MEVVRDYVKNLVGEISGRVKAEKEELLNAVPHIDIEKIKLQFEVFEELREQPLSIKRATHFNRLCQKKTIFIDNNPLVGTLTQYKYGSYPIPEFGSRWLNKTSEFSLQRGKATVTPEEMTWLRRAAEFWWDSNVFNRAKRIILDTFDVDIGKLQSFGLGTEYTPGGFGNVTPDFTTVLSQGITSIISTINKKMTNIDTRDTESVCKWQFYLSAKLALTGIITLAERYADLAEDMAVRETDYRRKAELENISLVCRHVPSQPPSNFREALQSAWFTQLGVWIEAPFVLNSPPGRLINILYPYYRADIANGAITENEVIELLQFYFLKLNGLAQVLPPHGYAWSQSRLGQHLCIGGLTSNNEDATTELDWLVLEAQHQLQMPEPLVDLLYHNRLSQDFLLKCLDLIKTGIGQPAIYNTDRAIIRHLSHHNMKPEEARNFSIFGCVQSWIPGYSLGPWEGALNVAKMIELALNDGVDPLSGNSLGPKTGKPEDFGTYDDFYAAFAAQVRHFLSLQRQIGCTAWKIERDFPLPFASTVVNDCVTRGSDVMDGGARYHAGNAMTFVGTVDSANSLAVIKKLVYEDKKLTFMELKTALANDFDGYDQVLQLCQATPKYGNDDPFVDSIAKQIYLLLFDEHQLFPDFLGRPSIPEAYSVTTHYATGRFTGALPSGRKSGQPLTDGSVSASPGTDSHGITALIRSAAQVIDTLKWGGNHFNLKFHPTVFRTLEGSRAVLAMIKTYFDLGGYHVQFNCVSAETLRRAQQHPEEYRNLVVRVAGFSAFFVHLDRPVQDEIIKRTEHKF
jgi:formate C-acetyltransferase